MDANLDQIVSDIDVQHQHLRKLADELKNSDHVHLIPMLEELTTLLEDHFMRETAKGGLYEAIGARSEEHREVERLEREHILMRSACRGLLARAKLSAAASEPALLQEIGEVMECLGDHERREHNMVERLMNA